MLSHKKKKKQTNLTQLTQAPGNAQQGTHQERRLHSCNAFVFLEFCKVSCASIHVQIHPGLTVMNSLVFMLYLLMFEQDTGLKGRTVASSVSQAPKYSAPEQGHLKYLPTSPEARIQVVNSPNSLVPQWSNQKVGEFSRHWFTALPARTENQTCFFLILQAKGEKIAIAHPCSSLLEMPKLTQLSESKGP